MGASGRSNTEIDSDRFAVAAIFGFATVVMHRILTAAANQARLTGPANPPKYLHRIVLETRRLMRLDDTGW
jgi:hypothetical protein